MIGTKKINNYQLTTRSYSHGRIWPYAVAVLIGVTAGSMPQLQSLFDGAPAIQRPPASGASQDSDNNQPLTKSNVDRSSADDRIRVDNSSSISDLRDADADDNLVIAGDGVVLRPAYSRNRFLGYEVVKSDSDERLIPGAIIVEVDGQPVENSAAGGELLMIGLRNPDAELSFAGRQ